METSITTDVADWAARCTDNFDSMTEAEKQQVLDSINKIAECNARLSTWIKTKDELIASQIKDWAKKKKTSIGYKNKFRNVR